MNVLSHPSLGLTVFFFHEAILHLGDFFVKEERRQGFGQGFVVGFVESQAPFMVLDPVEVKVVSFVGSESEPVIDPLFNKPTFFSDRKRNPHALVSQTIDASVVILPVDANHDFPANHGKCKLDVVNDFLDPGILRRLHFHYTTSLSFCQGGASRPRRFWLVLDADQKVQGPGELLGHAVHGMHNGEAVGLVSRGSPDEFPDHDLAVLTRPVVVFDHDLVLGHLFRQLAIVGPLSLVLGHLGRFLGFDLEAFLSLLFQFLHLGHEGGQFVGVGRSVEGEFEGVEGVEDVLGHV